MKCVHLFMVISLLSKHKPQSVIRKIHYLFCLKTLYFLAIRKLRLSTTQRNRGVCLHIEGVFSNDRFGINTYDIQIQAEFIHVFLLTHICRCLYFITFNLRNRHFCPPKCPRDKKGTKKIRPSSAWGTNEGQNCFFVLC